MKSIVFRVRKQYFDAIVAGEKTVEYRKDSPFWRKRLGPIADKKFPGQQEQIIAVFLCGKQIHRRLITEVHQIRTPDNFSEQGKKDVSTELCYAVYLGEEVKNR